MLKEAYLSLEDNVKILTQNSEAQSIEYDSKISKLNTTLSDKDEQIKSLQNELTSLQENKQVLEQKLTRYIQNEELKTTSFNELSTNVGRRSIYDDSIDSMYEVFNCFNEYFILNDQKFE